MPVPVYRKRRTEKPRRRKINGFMVFFILVFAIALVVPFVWASLEPKVDRHDIRIPNLRSDLRGLKIAYITDIHQCAWFSQDRVNKLIKQVNGLNADIVIFGGDYSTNPEGAIRFFANLPKVNFGDAVVAVLGENDRDVYDLHLSDLISVISGKGIIPLVNNCFSIKRPEGYVVVCGLDDLVNGDPDANSVAAQVSENDYVICVAHSPDQLEKITAAKSREGKNHWFDLLLFGSTHGGQVNLLGGTPFADLKPAMGKRYMGGWLEEYRANILVSRGVGTSYLPVRLFSSPEIHLITLKNK